MQYLFPSHSYFCCHICFKYKDFSYPSLQLSKEFHFLLTLGNKNFFSIFLRGNLWKSNLLFLKTISCTYLRAVTQGREEFLANTASPQSSSFNCSPTFTPLQRKRMRVNISKGEWNGCVKLIQQAPSHKPCPVLKHLF